MLQSVGVCSRPCGGSGLHYVRLGVKIENKMECEGTLYEYLDVRAQCGNDQRPSSMIYDIRTILPQTELNSCSVVVPALPYLGHWGLPWPC